MPAFDAAENACDGEAADPFCVSMSPVKVASPLTSSVSATVPLVENPIVLADGRYMPVLVSEINECEGAATVPLTVLTFVNVVDAIPVSRLPLPV